MTLAELRAALEAANARMTTVHEAAEARSDEARTAAEADDYSGPSPAVAGALTDDERAEWDDAETEATALVAQVQRAEAIERAGTAVDALPAPNVIRKRDDGFEIARDAAPAEVVDEARSIIGGTPGIPTRSREALTGLMDDEARSVTERATLGRYIAASENPEYRSAFRRSVLGSGSTVLSPQESDAVRAVAELRATLSIDSSSWTPPTSLDPTFVQTGDRHQNPLGSGEVATVETITTTDRQINTMDGVIASWDDELEEVSDDAPGTGTVGITPQMPKVYVPYSIRSEQDFAALEMDLLTNMQRGVVNLEATGFWDGTGVAPLPEGLAVGATQTVTQGAAGELVEDDLLALRAALPQRARGNASWLAEQSVFDRIRSQDFWTNGINNWRPGMEAGNPDSLYSMPVHEYSAMTQYASLVATDEMMVYGDIAQAFRVVRRFGMTVEPIPIVFGANGRPKAERGLFAYWRVGSAVVDPGAVRVLVKA